MANPTDLKCPSGMCFIPTSRFMMGSPDGILTSGNETPQHEVEVSAVSLDKHEVTNEEYNRYLTTSQGQAQFELIAKSCGSSSTSIVARGNDPKALIQGNRSKLDGDKVCGLEVKTATPIKGNPSPEGFDGPKQPVVNVSWDEAKAYCEAQGKRLPTEAEWEKGAIGLTKGYDKRVQYGTRSGQLSEAEAVYNTGRTADVCSKPENGYGLCDMTGNVWEWVSDRYDKDYYKHSPAKDPTGPTEGDTRVLRGGSWGYYGPGFLRVSNRYGDPPGARDLIIGIRCASAPQDSQKKQ